MLKLAKKLKKGLKTEHIPLALLETAKMLTFCLSPIYVHGSIWIFLANGELFVSYAISNWGKFNLNSKGISVILFALGSFLALF